MNTNTKDKTNSATSTVKSEASNVASTAKDEAANVASEATAQVKNLTSEATSQVSEKVNEKAHSQRDVLADFVRTFSSDLEKMASGQHASGPAADWARKASVQLSNIGDSIAQKDPSELLTDVQQFARRKPGVFLAVAATAGVVAGRFVSAARQDSDGVEGNQSVNGYAASPDYVAPPVPPTSFVPVEPLTDLDPRDAAHESGASHLDTHGTNFSTHLDDTVPRNLESDFGDRGSKGGL